MKNKTDTGIICRIYIQPNVNDTYRSHKLTNHNNHNPCQWQYYTTTYYNVLNVSR